MICCHRAFTSSQGAQPRPEAAAPAAERPVEPASGIPRAAPCRVRLEWLDQDSAARWALAGWLLAGFGACGRIACLVDASVGCILSRSSPSLQPQLNVCKVWGRGCGSYCMKVETMRPQSLMLPAGQARIL